ncbi:MAG: hypothetical protein F4X97_01695 [Boseongicola sp. SB0662_bin_57]|nr:hypothetical protein [Boseongicola sp. SB0662_bin_57]
MRAAIIGGSLSGCMAAILLGRAGHDVTVYERSKSGLVGRGGGLTTSRKVLDEMKSRDLIDAEFPASPFDILRMCKRTDDEPYLGVNPLSAAIDMHCVHWGGLWRNLVKRVPSERYKRGRTLAAAQDLGNSIKLVFEDGGVEDAELVLFCDGYNSMGRLLLFPEVEPGYRGYLVWRGILPDCEVADHAPLADHPRYSYVSIKGSFVSFVIPSIEGSTVPGERTINWAAYIPADAGDLDHFLIDRHGTRRNGTVPSGEMRDDLDDELKALMARELPDYYADILAKSTGNQIQLIYTSELPGYGKGRMGLCGDAGMVVQPMTGAGVFKGLSNAADLVDALAGHADVPTAVADWSRRQTAVARRMLALGNQMEDAFIWNTIDLAGATAEACRAWWSRSITIPGEFSYFADIDDVVLT